jgi:hypothetical protein
MMRVEIDWNKGRGVLFGGWVSLGVVEAAAFWCCGQPGCLFYDE